jgi:hypothetical protein
VGGRRIWATLDAGGVVIDVLERAVGDADSLLDVGCGNNSPVGRFSRRPRFSVGVDLYEPWLEESRRKGIHDEYVRANVLDIGRLFGPGRFEVVLACDLLEHLEPDDAARLLGLMETIASKRVVVLTPNGFVPQGETWGNPLQVHRSGWTVDTFHARGYDVGGLNGVRWTRGERGEARVRPRRVGERIATLSQPVAGRYPGLAFHLLATKHLVENIPL